MRLIKVMGCVKKQLMGVRDRQRDTVVVNIRRENDPSLYVFSEACVYIDRIGRST